MMDTNTFLEFFSPTNVWERQNMPFFPLFMISCGLWGHCDRCWGSVLRHSLRIFLLEELKVRGINAQVLITQYGECCKGPVLGAMGVNRTSILPRLVS